MKPKVMIVGFGSLGAAVLDCLAREPDIGEIVVASRDRRRVERRCNLARISALALGVVPRIRVEPLDLDDVGRSAESIARQAPDLIVSTATRQTWWLADLLPGPAGDALSRAPFGAWLPVHLSLAIKFMQAVRAADFRGHALVASFPDVVNVVLARIGLAPTCGLGNLDEIVPKLGALAAERLRVSPRAIRVLLVAHHALEPFVFGSPGGEAPPFWLRVEWEGRDVTERVAAPRLLFEPWPLPAGPSWHLLTAASASRLILALCGASPGLLHVPAPGGLPGGYPAIAERGGVHLLDLPGLDRGHAVAINERSQPFDGIERIEADGAVQFTDRAAGVMRETLGYNCGRLGADECDGRATELVARFRDYAARHGVDLAAAEAASRMIF